MVSSLTSSIGQGSIRGPTARPMDFFQGLQQRVETPEDSNDAHRSAEGSLSYTQREQLAMGRHLELPGTCCWGDSAIQCVNNVHHELLNLAVRYEFADLRTCLWLCSIVNASSS